MDLSQNNNNRMETICDSVNTVIDTEEIKISNDNEKKSSLDESNQESNLKLKRCKHGRIIIKDLSKKKPVQQGDKDANQIQSKNSDTKEELQQSRSIVDENLPRRSCEEISPPNLTLNVYNNSSSNNEFMNSPKGDKLRERKERGPEEAGGSKGDKSRSSPSTRRRSRTPVRRRISSRSPSHRKSPRRDRCKSPYRRHQSRSPRRRDRSRSPRTNRTGSQKTSSSKRVHHSPKRGRSSPSSHRRNRQSSRNKNPRRQLSRSRSRSRSRSACQITNSASNLHRDASRSPGKEGFRRDRFLHDPGHDRTLRRKEMFIKSPKGTDDRRCIEGSNLNKVDNFVSSKLISEAHLSNQAQNPQESLKTSLQHHSISTQPTDSKHLSKTATLVASPKKSLSARSSMTPSSNDSTSSDIYDPEGPIIPISPGDSPPMSPMNKAANNKITYRLDGEKNDDDVPSSAVQLNHQEKYLQKLNRQERVVEEIKIALKPHYQKRAINKEQYKDVLRRAVPKICHSKNGEINPVKIRSLVDAYVKKMKRRK